MAQTKLGAKVLARHATLALEEIAELVVDNKWMASVDGAITQKVEPGGLMDRVRVLEQRYAKALPNLTHQVEIYGARVEVHLKRMLLSI